MGAVSERPAEITCPVHGEHPHGGPLVVCLDCPICRPPAAEPQQPDVSVLDLVRQYGDAIGGSVSAGECAGPDEVWKFEQEAQALLDRIAALLSQQPVQARDDLKRPLWQHACAAVTAFAEPPESGIDCTWCPQVDGPWLPLLVGGTPAPGGAAPNGELQALNDHVHHYAVGGGGRVPLWESGSGALRTYGALLAGSGPLTVEEAAPREPRTWLKIDEEPDELPRLVHVEDHGQWTLKYGIYISVGNLYDEAYNLLQLRMLGHVTEVFDNDQG